MHTSDDWYEQLMNAHRGLSDAQSQRLNAALVLLLANELANPGALGVWLKDARVAALTPENE
jgi:hypothetical protein